MSPRTGVRVGNVRPMSGGIMPMDSVPPPPITEEEERQRRVENIVRGTGGSVINDPFGLGGYFNLIKQGLASNKQAASGSGVSQTPMFTDGRVMGAIQAGQMDTGQIPYASAGGQYQPTRADIAAQIAAQLGIGAGGGGGAARPDFSAYRAALTDQAQQINAQIQAMYKALGEEAGANVGRIQDIYGGASTGIGDVYGSAISNVGDAYGSAQQQASDQLARLGIEQAAPAVINPMALSQAEAVSQLEQGQAGGLAATERFGSAASGFGSQMAQVAQQQGTEMNAAILASLQNRLMDSLAAEQSGGGGGGGGGMSVSDRLRLAQYADEVYNRDVLGELPLNEREFAASLAGQQQRTQADIFNAAIALVQEGLYDNMDDALTAARLGYSGY
jgi:hypothetical protein